MKEKLGALLSLYPSLVTIVGTTVRGKPNFTTIAHVGIMDMNSLSLSMNKAHYSNDGIKANKTFSVNIPSEYMVKATDYAGIVSGKDVDKSKLFKTFYGELKTAPMIEDCPLNMECRLMTVVDYPNHDLFIGDVVQTYANKEILVNGDIDFEKVRPMLFCMSNKSYHGMGLKVGDCWKIGKDYKK
jgi:flavin reductase (DIM6/NTAB) family NADH-FMN oxidoreductase RutF